MKPLTAQNGGAFKKQSSASLPVSDTSTQVASAENMHSWDRGLEPGRQSTPLGISGEHFPKTNLVTWSLVASL